MTDVVLLAIGSLVVLVLMLFALAVFLIRGVREKWPRWDTIARNAFVAVLAVWGIGFMVALCLVIWQRHGSG